MNSDHGGGVAAWQRRNVVERSGRDPRWLASSSPVFGLSGDVHTSQTQSGEQTRLSSCHGDSRVFTTVGRVISSLSAATIADGLPRMQADGSSSQPLSE